jgi:hypothetical protein
MGGNGNGQINDVSNFFEIVLHYKWSGCTIRLRADIPDGSTKNLLSDLLTCPTHE